MRDSDRITTRQKRPRPRMTSSSLALAFGTRSRARPRATPSRARRTRATRTRAMMIARAPAALAVSGASGATRGSARCEKVRARTSRGGVAWARERRARAGVATAAGAVDAIGEIVSRAQDATANAHAALVTSPLFELAEAIDYDNAEELKKAGIQKGGWLGPITDALEGALRGIDGLLDGKVPYSYGYSILVLTVLVKLATFPLSKQQVESSLQMQAMQPRIKELQAMYANDPERLQLEQARLYREANFNPLAGCLPLFATLPVFIGLYRALSNAAAEHLLDDGFYWIPSLGGPTSIAARNDGNGFAWLWPFVDGAPPLGWHDTICYLVLPVLLVASQYVSQAIISPPPKTDDPAQQQSQAILKFLPLMIGFFSLNVPAGLTLYWFANNIITTTQTLVLRKITKTPEMPAAGARAGAPASAEPVRVEYVPRSQRRSGAPMPVRPPPKVEEVSEVIAAEFADFDDGPAKVVEVDAKVVDADAASKQAPPPSKPANNRKKRRGSR